MDELTDKQLRHLRDLCKVEGPAPGEPLQRLAFVGLTAFGLMLDHDLTEREAATAKKSK